MLIKIRFHSAVNLVTNSSGEVFVIKKDQIPDGVADLINNLWKIWITNVADDWDKEHYADKFGPDFNAAELFGFEPIAGEDEIHYGRDNEENKRRAVADFFKHVHEAFHRGRAFSSEADPEMIERVLTNEGNEDILFMYDLYAEWKAVAEADMEAYRQARAADPDQTEVVWPSWPWEMDNIFADMVIDLGYFDEIEGLAKLFASSEGMFGQWRWVTQSFDMYHAYDGAEYVGEIDDHVYPQAFVRYVCDTFGWFTYHNG
jgi:hypothetical protein